MGSCTLQYLGKYEKIAHNLISKLSCLVPNLKRFYLHGVRDKQMEIFLTKKFPKVKFKLKKEIEKPNSKVNYITKFTLKLSSK